MGPLGTIADPVIHLAVFTLANADIDQFLPLAALEIVPDVGNKVTLTIQSDGVTGEVICGDPVNQFSFMEIRQADESGPVGPTGEAGPSGATGHTGETGPTGAVITDHGLLTGLLDDDHTQYLLEDGTRPISDDWDNTGQRIRNTGTSEVTSTEPPVTVPGLIWLDTSVSGGIGPYDHGALAGLADDDHPQYVLADGSRAVTGTFTTNAGNIFAMRTETSDYAILTSDYTILADATSATVTALLPASPNQGQIFYVKCINDTFAVTVSGNGNNIDGLTTGFALIQNESLTLQFDSTYGWVVL
jgi:hypothetical protein